MSCGARRCAYQARRGAAREAHGNCEGGFSGSATIADGELRDMRGGCSGDGITKVIMDLVGTEARGERTG